ncbi:MAG: helix-turn-helix transcriptional regulator [Spirochaetota bacterium]
MRDRIIAIIDILGFTQKKFADQIGITAGGLTDFIKGRSKDLSSSTVANIVIQFNVNPTWLLTGEGEMFVTSPPSPLLKERGAELPVENDMSKSTSQKKQNGHLSGINGNVETFPGITSIEQISRTGWWDLLSALKKFIFAGLDEIQDPEFLGMLKTMINFQVLKERAEKDEAETAGLKQKGEAG